MDKNASRSILPTACNGSPAFCDRKYSNITLVGAHDSPFVGPLAQHNQNIDVVKQLNLGIRFLQGQVHLSPRRTWTEENKTATSRPEPVLELCHTSCFLEDAGTLEKYLATVKKWMDTEENANEVVTMLFVNWDAVGMDVFDQAFERSGIKKYVFDPGPKVLTINEWPSLMEMIYVGQRLVVFLDYGASPISPYSYILDEFAYFFETPFDTTDPTFSDCSVHRPPAVSPTERGMYIVNHFLDIEIMGVYIPDRVHAPRTNAVRGYGSIGEQCDLCLAVAGRMPNVVLVDFVDQGNVIEAQRVLNSDYALSLVNHDDDLMLLRGLFLVFFLLAFCGIIVAKLRAMRYSHGLRI